jgi:hypothetical protein
MRLTLRTLLAYLDDTLDPAQARLIGQKVAESDAAQELIARIKQVTRRRRLTAPPMTGPGGKLDPNSIAEYLDNALSADQLADVEETCLASDVHLAEIAACHQILTIVLGEPALVPPTARQRMYRLVRGREAIPDRKAAARAVGQRALAGADSLDDESDEALLLGLPLQRPGSWLRWALPIAVVCLLVGASVALWMALRSPSPPLALGTGRTVEPESALAKVEKNATPDNPPPVRAESHRESTTPPVALPEKKAEPENKPPVRPEVKHPGTETPAAASKPTPRPDVEPAPIPQTPQPSKDRRELGRYVMVSPSVLLQRSAPGETFQRLRPDSRLRSTDYLVSLPGYQSELRLDKGVQLVLWGNAPEVSGNPLVEESAIVLHSDPSLDADFTLDRGRVIVANHKDQGPARVRLRFHGEIWDVTLPDKDSVVAVDLIGRCQPSDREPIGEPETYVRIYALKGAANLRAAHHEFQLPSPSVFDWDNLGGAAPGPQPIPRAPDWWTHAGTSRLPGAKEMQTALDGLSRRLIAKDSLEVVLAESLKEGEMATRVLALRCLGAMDDLSRLVNVLTGVQFSETLRVRAIDVLRHLLGFGLSYDNQLTRLLEEKNHTPDQAKTVLQLLHGFSDQQWADPNTRTTLVEYLNSDKLAIRQLTHTLLLFRIPQGQKIAYDPAGEKRLRHRGYEEWQRLVSAVGQERPER